MSKIRLLSVVAAFTITSLPAASVTPLEAQEPGEETRLPQQETFDAGAPADWQLLGAVSVAQDARGGVLELSGPGQAVWVGAPVRDFTLSFQYRPGQGEGDVMLRGSGEGAENRGYHLLLHENGLTLVRLEAGREQPLTGADVPWAESAWHRVAVTASGGDLTIAVDGTPLTAATDPQPLSTGVVGLGAAAGSGFAYDDVSLTSPATTAAMPAAGDGQGEQVIPINIPDPQQAADTGRMQPKPAGTGRDTTARRDTLRG